MLVSALIMFAKCNHYIPIAHSMSYDFEISYRGFITYFDQTCTLETFLLDDKTVKKSHSWIEKGVKLLYSE